MKAARRHRDPPAPTRPAFPARSRGCRGVTLVETMVATAVMAVLGVALGSAAEVVLAVDREADSAWRTYELGLALLEEIASLPFDDPQSAGTTLGPEFGEWVPLGNRAHFDDVDDYAVWNDPSGLQEKDGTPLAMKGYTRTVAVDYVIPSDFGIVSLAATDYKRITVKVYLSGQCVGTYVTVRVQGGRNVDFDG